MTYSAEVLADSPAAYYRLGEPSGTTMVDSSGNGRDGTYVGGGADLTLGATGLLTGDADTAISVGGAGTGYGTLAPAAWMTSLTAITLEIWLNPANITGTRLLFGRTNLSTNNNNNYQAYLSQSSGNLRFTVRHGSTLTDYTTPSPVLTIGTRVHVVGTYDGSHARLYVDGVKVLETASTGALSPGTTVNLRIGRTDFAGSYAFGTLDEAAVYPVALSDERIARHYLAGRDHALLDYDDEVLTDVPLAYYRLGEPSGTTMVDSSGNGRDGTYVNAPGLAATGLIVDADTAVDYDGSADYASAPSSGLNPTTLSVEAWVKPDSVAAGDYFIAGRADWNSTYGSGRYSYSLNRNGADLYFDVWLTGSLTTVRRITVTGAFTVGQTYHIVGTFGGSGATNRVYINGVLRGSLAVSGTVNAGTTTIFTIARNETFSGGHFDGTIDEVAVYGAVLPRDRVIEHYLSGIYGADSSVEVIEGGLVEETGEPLGGTLEATLEGGLAEETGEPLDGTADNSTTIEGGLVEETGEPLDGSHNVGLPGGLTEETGEPLPGSADEPGTEVPGGLVEETGEPLDGSLDVTIEGGLVEETGEPLAGDTALVITGTSQPLIFAMDPGILRVTSNLVLVILNPELERAPDLLEVVVSGANPDAELVFTIDGVEVWTDFADADGRLEEGTIPVPADAAAGSHTLVVTSVDNGSDSEDFDLLLSPEILPEIPDPDADPELPPDSVNRWVLYDVAPSGLGAWVMPKNPDSMTPPHFDRTVAVRHTTAVDTGVFHVTESSMRSKPWRIGGYCPDQDYYDQLQAYADLNRRIWVIDHRRRAWKVAISGLTVEPRKRQSDEVSEDNDWAGKWEMSLTILDQTEIQMEED